jgi:RNA polymerase sigma-70 factor (ECF subfamily)
MPEISPQKTKDFVEAYDQFADAIFRHIYFRIYNRDLAKDLTQETFTRTWQYLSQGKEVQSLKSFLYKVANNLIIDEYRKRKELSLDSLQEKGFDFANRDVERIMIDTENKHVLNAVEKLSSDHRDVIFMRFVSDLSIKEIAEIIGQSENVVSVRLNRGLKEVRKLLHL